MKQVLYSRIETLGGRIMKKWETPELCTLEISETAGNGNQFPGEHLGYCAKHKNPNATCTCGKDTDSLS